MPLRHRPDGWGEAHEVEDSRSESSARNNPASQGCEKEQLYAATDGDDIDTDDEVDDEAPALVKKRTICERCGRPVKTALDIDCCTHCLRIWHGDSWREQ